MIFLMQFILTIISLVPITLYQKLQFMDGITSVHYFILQKLILIAPKIVVNPTAQQLMILFIIQNVLVTTAVPVALKP